MKKLFSGLLAILAFTLIGYAQAPNEKIGIVEKGRFKLTSNLEKIKADWTAALKAQKINTQLVNFSIASALDAKLNNETYYYLIGKNTDSSTKMAILLTLKDNGFYIPTEGKLYNTGTVTCSGCSYGCNPEKNYGKWYCMPACGPNETCTKTVTVPY